MEQVPQKTRLSDLLSWCEAEGASDLHGRGGAGFMIRVDGRLKEVPQSLFPFPEDLTLTSWFLDAFSPPLVARITVAREVDSSFYHGERRYRANFSKQRGRQSFSFRVVPQQRMRLEDLQLPESLADIAMQPRGLILVTGPTGQGKSTTTRAMIQHLNENSALRIITVEDPIEYVFTDAESHFEQREVGIDTDSFAAGIRNAMRQDPNVIFVGEIRDRESIWAAMQAAETGHLVITTLHADSVAQAIGRIREFYPADEQASVSALLARNLNAVICQRLLPNREGSRTPCLEIMLRDAGISGAIMENNLVLLTGIVEASNHVGMHSFDQYLQELLAAEIIDESTARAYAVNRHRLDLTLRGVVTTQSILSPQPNR
ncbi:MAG TPA: PilT/PilU family type 4a pilus ATPase [Candidatus Limnocylindria bacterium]|nr:PilT/PilU family type 4a pilus ATPase [Candidatus Limnocylindria bacterium]